MMEGNVKNRTYIYVWLGHFAVRQKLAEYCKSSTTVKITIIKKNTKNQQIKTKKQKKALTHPERICLPEFPNCVQDLIFVLTTVCGLCVFLSVY